MIKFFAAPPLLLIAAVTAVPARADEARTQPAEFPSAAEPQETNAQEPGAEPQPSGASPAKPAAPRYGMTIEEIVVTAQKREESIADIPISISAFSGEDLQALGVTDTRDLGKIVPGFTVADSSYNTPVYTLRGVGFNDTSYTAASTVSVYLDEVPLPYSIMTKGAALDLERVEVLKGPQGTLYGRNTTGGAINYIARKPTETFEAGVTPSYGRFNTTDIEGFVSGKAADSLYGRLAVKDTRSQEGWQYSNTRPDDRLGRRSGVQWNGTPPRTCARAWSPTAGRIAASRARHR